MSERAQRIIRPDTAFSLSNRKQKRPRQVDDAHRKWIKTLPCVVTGSRVNVDPAHVSFGDLAFAKDRRGKGMKVDDKYLVPLCRVEHDKQHSQGEQKYWESTGINPIIVALSLFAETGDDEAAALILAQARQTASNGTASGLGT